MAGKLTRTIHGYMQSPTQCAHGAVLVNAGAALFIKPPVIAANTQAWAAFGNYLDLVQAGELPDFTRWGSLLQIKPYHEDTDGEGKQPEGKQSAGDSSSIEDEQSQVQQPAVFAEQAAEAAQQQAAYGEGVGSSGDGAEM